MGIDKYKALLNYTDFESCFDTPYIVTCQNVLENINNVNGRHLFI